MESIRLYDYIGANYATNTNILDVGKVFQELVSVTTSVLAAGHYIFSFSWEADYNGQKNQPFETQLTGTFPSAIYSDSAGDNDVNIKTRTYSVTEYWAGGAITMGLDGRKGDSFLASLDILKAGVTIYRVG